MDKEEIEEKIRKSLAKFYNDTEYYSAQISIFSEKLKLLSNRGKYNKLLKAFSSSNELGEFRSYVFEALFGYDFESKGESLIYEVKEREHDNTSIDFRCDLDQQRTIFFELRLIHQRECLSKSISRQLEESGCYTICLNGVEEASVIFRLQNLMLEKCQDKSGNPVKFGEPKKGKFNIIVVDVSRIMLDCIDEHDCMLAMCGDAAVERQYQLNIFGLCQDDIHNASEKVVAFHEKSEHFRRTIHGVLFAKNKEGADGLLDRELEYLLIGNPQLLEQNDGNTLREHLGSFLNPWS